MVHPASKSPEKAAPARSLLDTATADFRANLRHSRSHSLLVDFYLKRGLSSDEIRQAIRNASTAPIRSIRVDLPAVAAA